jgi:hypothetical protein
MQDRARSSALTFTILTYLEIITRVSRMRASSRKLAVALADRLNSVVPAPWRVSARAKDIDVYIRDELALTSHSPEIIENEDDPEWTLPERAATVVYGVLSSIQDSVSEYLHEPWPTPDGREMAMPGVRTDPEFVHLWFGANELAPVISIPAISFGEIMGAGDER